MRNKCFYFKSLNLKKIKNKKRSLNFEVPCFAAEGAEMGLSEELRVNSCPFHRAINAIVKRVDLKPDSLGSVINFTTD